MCSICFSSPCPPLRYIYLPFYLSIYFFIHLHTFLKTHQSTYLSIYLSSSVFSIVLTVYLSIYLSCLSTYLQTHLSHINLHIYLPIVLLSSSSSSSTNSYQCSNSKRIHIPSFSAFPRAMLLSLYIFFCSFSIPSHFAAYLVTRISFLVWQISKGKNIVICDGIIDKFL